MWVWLHGVSLLQWLNGLRIQRRSPPHDEIPHRLRVFEFRAAREEHVELGGVAGHALAADVHAPGVGFAGDFAFDGFGFDERFDEPAVGGLFHGDVFHGVEAGEVFGAGGDGSAEWSDGNDASISAEKWRSACFISVPDEYTRSPRLCASFRRLFT